MPVMSTVDILTVSVLGGDADAEKLWPECEALGEWSDEGEPERWEDLWKQRNKRPHDIWITQGVGEGLPILVPLARDLRGDRCLMDQLVDLLRRLRGAPDPEKGDLLPFEEAYQNLREARDVLRANPFNCEKDNDKLPDEFPGKGILMTSDPSLRMMGWISGVQMTMKSCQVHLSRLWKRM